ncbi:MAG TPA: FHA domain-containing protein [Thermoanaerobaculia bacterium]|nr:FHA domain-containing protein [Thermoanaerobaculia bacterium]
MSNDPMMLLTGIILIAAAVVGGVVFFRRKTARPNITPSGHAGSSTRPRDVAAPVISPQRTVMMEMPGEEVPTGTVAMQWHGLLVCTAGDLEGERFIIEDDGLYIGRDATLSKVVINDSRVSKRHVRISIRDGKVVASDEDSTNGTYLNATGTPRITEVTLKKGDTLILADSVASFKYQI